MKLKNKSEEDDEYSPSSEICSHSESSFELNENTKVSNKSKKGSRRHKSSAEIKILEDCYEMDNKWTKETVDFIKVNTKLTESQIYKWGYDQKRKRTCKNGIRDELRERRRRKLSDSFGNDYNTMVNELFPEEQSESSPIPMLQKLNMVKSQFNSEKSIRLFSDKETAENDPFDSRNSGEKELVSENKTSLLSKVNFLEFDQPSGLFDFKKWEDNL